MQKFVLYLLFLCIFLCRGINTTPLRVLFCVKSFPSHTSWFILNQIAEFIKAGHQVTILARDPQPTSDNDNHPHVITYKLLEKTWVNYLPKDKKTFDLILCQFSSLAPYVIDFKEQYNIKGALFVFVRGAFCHRHAYQQQLRNKIFQKTDLFLPVCNFSKKRLLELGCDHTKIIVVPSTIDCDVFAFKSRSFPKNSTQPIRIVTTGRLTEQKGLEYAIKAMAKVLKIYPNTTYTIIGDGELRTSLEQLIHDLGLENNIFLVGWKTPKQVRTLLYNSHIFIHPSVTKEKNGGHEGIPTAIMEAMATGLPTICTYHAGIPELIKHNKNGFLIREKDEIALAQMIISLIDHPERWPALGIAGRNAIIKKHHSTTQNKKFMDLCIRYITQSKHIF